MSEPLDLITVHCQADREVAADRVDLVVNIRGDALFSGAEALKKAREVRALMDGLMALGMEEGCVSVEDIQAFTEKGLFTRSSSALYRLRVRCEDLEKLADILELTTGLDAATLAHLVWGYDQALTETKAKLLQRCALEARDKAADVAAALGVELGALHRLTELDGSEPTRQHMTDFLSAGMLESKGRRKSRSLKDELSFSIVHKTRVEVRARAEYRIRPKD